MQMCAGRGFTIQEFAVEQAEAVAAAEIRAIHLQLVGRHGVQALVLSIGDIKGAVSVRMSPMRHAKD